MLVFLFCCSSTSEKSWYYGDTQIICRGRDKDVSQWAQVGGGTRTH